MKGVVNYLLQVLAGRVSTSAAQPRSQVSFVDWDENEILEDALEAAEEKIAEKALPKKRNGPRRRSARRRGNARLSSA